MSLENNMDRVLARRNDIESKLADAAGLSSEQLTQLSRELAEIKPVAEQVEIVRQLQQSLEDARDIAAEETDDELVELALAETEELVAQLPDEKHKLKLLLLPKDTDDARNAIIEVRAGTGGEEAALFASDFLMYVQLNMDGSLRSWISQKQALAAIKRRQQIFQVRMCSLD